MVIDAWMRTGDSHSATDAVEFLTELFTIVPQAQVGLLRGDSGFYSHKIMNYLEEQAHPVPYVFRARMTGALTAEILSHRRFWHKSDVVKGAAYLEFEYQASTWKTTRRIVEVRMSKNGRRNIQKELFEEYEELSRYDYMAYVTNTSLSMVEVHRRYNQRGDSENRIRELKQDYGIDGFALQHFGAMEAASRFVMVAYNIMTIFKQAIMNSRRYHYLSTIRFQCIAIGSYLVTRGRKIKMNLQQKGNEGTCWNIFSKIWRSLDHPISFLIDELGLSSW